MKWGPLGRFLQNLPESHPHPLLISAVPCLRRWCSSPSAVTAAASMNGGDSSNTSRTGKERYHNKAELQNRITHLMSAALSLSCRCAPSQYLSENTMKLYRWRKLTYIVALTEKYITSCQNVSCQCRCSTANTHSSLQGNNLIIKKSWNDLLCHHTVSCLVDTSQAAKLLRTINVALFTGPLLLELKYFAFLFTLFESHQGQQL